MPPEMIRELALKRLAQWGWSLKKLADETGISYSRIHDWLATNGKGTRGPSAQNMESIFRVLNIEVRLTGSAKPRKAK